MRRLPRFFKCGSKDMEASWIVSWGRRNFLVDLSWGLPVRILTWTPQSSNRVIERMTAELMLAMLKHLPRKDDEPTSISDPK